MIQISDGPRASGGVNFLSLPTELITAMLEYLPIAELNQVSGTCRQLRDICNHLSVWRDLGRQCINFNAKPLGDCSSNEQVASIPVRELCRIAHNWTMGHCTEHRLIKFKTSLLPWLQLSGDQLYVSVMEQIVRQSVARGNRQQTHRRAKRGLRFTGHSQDISKFVVRGNDVISCGRDGQVIIWDRSSGQRLGAVGCELSSMMAIDACREVLIGGTNNRGVQVWRRSDLEQVHHIPMVDRVWSVLVDPSQRMFATGSSGNTDYNSLKLWDIETCRSLQVCGENKRRGEGVLDLRFESSQVLLSAGYDTFIRLWDVRSPSLPVLQLEEPNDNIVYCISSDNNHLIAAGSCRHGVVRFWDKRKTDECIQTFYVSGTTRSPVYSLQFDRNSLYAALSQGVYHLDFSGYKT